MKQKIKEKPITLDSEMVKAILDGQKTQVRSIMNPQPVPYKVHLPMELGEFSKLMKNYTKNGYDLLHTQGLLEGMMTGLPDYAYPETMLYVRESWQHTKYLNLPPTDENYRYVYAADGQDWKEIDDWKWNPAATMPKDAIRLWLKVTDVHPAKLHDIDEAGVLAEGITIQKDATNPDAKPQYKRYGSTNVWLTSPKDSFKSYWIYKYGGQSWALNPYVWVTTFERLKK